MRRFVHAAIVGALLSLMRALPGIELTQWPAVEPRAAHGVRALGLGLAALGVWCARDLRASSLAALALGFALHGLVLARIWSPATPTELWIVWVAAIPLLLWPRLARAAADTVEEERPSLAEMLGLALTGAGATLVLEGIARHLRLFGTGLAQDDSLFASVLLAIVAFGALSLGWIAAAARPRGIAMPATFALAAAGGYASLHVIRSIASMRGLDLYLRRFGIDTLQQGTWKYDALLAASCFVVPGLLLGAALCASRRRERLVSPVIGAAIAIAIVPAILARGPASADGAREIYSAHLVPIGTLVALVGALFAVLAHTGARARTRWVAAAPVLGAFVLPAAVRVEAQFVVAPWRKIPVFPRVTFESPAGLVTVEPTPGGLDQVTLDRRALTPETSDLDADAQRLLLSLDVLAPARRVRPDLRVLLVGQLTPIRGRVLLDAGVGTIDRTGAWWESMERIEGELFGGAERPRGAILSPSDASRRIREQSYDVVIAPPVEGDPPSPSSLDAPGGTTVVAWMFMDQPLPRGDLGEFVMVYADGLEDPSIAVLANPGVAPSGEATSALFLAPGERVRTPTPIEWLRLRKFERTDRAHSLAAERFARAARGTQEEELTAGLASFYAAQQYSSPFESREARIELPAESLERFRSAALARPPNVFVRKLWEELAEVLIGKRWIEETYAYVEPIAERYAPWDALELALARADLESLDAESARKRLEALARAQPQVAQYAYWLSRAQRELGDVDGAAHSLRRVIELAPSDTRAQRELAILLIGAGDPEGRRIAEELLQRNPDDEQLEALIEGRPYDGGGSHDGHDH